MDRGPRHRHLDGAPPSGDAGAWLLLGGNAGPRISSDSGLCRSPISIDGSGGHDRGDRAGACCAGTGVACRAVMVLPGSRMPFKYVPGAAPSHRFKPLHAAARLLLGGRGGRCWSRLWRHWFWPQGFCGVSPSTRTAGRDAGFENHLQREWEAYRGSALVSLRTFRFRLAFCG